MQGDDSPHGGRDRTATGLGWPLAASTLVVVLAMVAIGVAGVLSAGGQGSERAGAPFAASASSAPAAVALTDVYFLDLRSGKTTDLPSSLTAIRNANHFRMSPDGSTVAFDDGNTLYVATIDGSHIRQFTPDDGVSAPSWSPDGARIVFSEGGGIFLVDVATGELTPVLRER